MALLSVVKAVSYNKEIRLKLTVDFSCISLAAYTDILSNVPQDILPRIQH